MSTPNTLRVRARTMGNQNHEALAAAVNPVNAFIGYRYEPLKNQPGGYGFVATNEVEEVAYHPDYVLAIQAGTLEAADQATADAAGVEFKKIRASSEAPKGGE